jgi:hypothetical protein
MLKLAVSGLISSADEFGMRNSRDQPFSSSSDSSATSNKSYSFSEVLEISNILKKNRQEPADILQCAVFSFLTSLQYRKFNITIKILYERIHSKLYCGHVHCAHRFGSKYRFHLQG